MDKKVEKQLNRIKKRLQKIYHPDRVGNDFIEISEQINAAYKVLTDEKKLETYIECLKKYELDDGLNI